MKWRPSLGLVRSDHMALAGCECNAKRSWQPRPAEPGKTSRRDSRKRINRSRSHLLSCAAVWYSAHNSRGDRSMERRGTKFPLTPRRLNNGTGRIKCKAAAWDRPPGLFRSRIRYEMNAIRRMALTVHSGGLIAHAGTTTLVSDHGH